MTDHPNNDDWLRDHSRSLVPTRKAPDRPIDEDALRENLVNAPEVPGEISQKKSKDDGEKDDVGAGKESAANARSNRAEKANARSSGRGGGKGRATRGRGEIFQNSPVTPLGIHGDQHWFLDTLGQLRSIGTNFQKNHMLSVFGGQVGLLAKSFPTYAGKSPTPKPADFNALELATAMIVAAKERGVWSPVGRVRGSGAWSDDDGQLIFHAGDEVLIGGKWVPPGVYDNKVYPASDPVPRPAPTGVRGDAGVEILEMIGSWNWARPEVDPMLALGAICAQMIGGALDWRPVTWLSGDQATGKSTFQRLLRYLHGGSEGLLQASDATEAGIRSVIGYSSMPVALDELEPDDDPKKGKAAAIIRLARIAASGDQILRGSTDQKGYQGNAYSCFLFSSILVPPLPPQDRSRLILLDLNRLGKDAPKPKDDPRRLRQLGAALRRNLIDGWSDWAERLDLWRAALAKKGHGGRTADNYGTVLALADMGLHTELPNDETMDGWVAKLDRFLKAETVEVGSNADDMLVHLMSQPLDVWRRGQRYNVASWVAMAARLPRAPEQIDTATPENANSYLAQYGLRVKGRGNDAVLAIANKPLSGLRTLFEGTPWAEGVWSQAARRVAGAEGKNMTFARVPSRGYVIPFSSIPGLLNAMETSAPVVPTAPPMGDEIEDHI
ncbi:MAG: hypothetical protein AB3N12_01545 [Ruegeria sp.]